MNRGKRLVYFDQAVNMIKLGLRLNGREHVVDEMSKWDKDTLIAFLLDSIESMDKEKPKGPHRPPPPIPPPGYKPRNF